MRSLRSRWRLPEYLLVSLVLGGALLATPGTARACSCEDTPLSEYADEVAVAFMGRQVGRTVPPPDSEGFVSSADPTTLVFEVERVYKGRVGPRITVHTVRFSESCGVDLRGRGSVGVVAFDIKGELRVNSCTSPVDATELLEVFGVGSPPDHGVVLEAEIEGLEGELEALGAEVSDLGVENGVLKAEIEGLEGELEALGAEVSDLGVENGVLKAEIESLGDRTSRLVLILAGGAAVVVVLALTIPGLRRRRG